MIGQHSGGKKEEWEIVSMCGLHGSKQSLPLRSLLDTSDRPIGGCNSWSSLDEFFRCFLGVPLNTIGSG